MITMIRMMMVVVIISGWNIEKTFGHRTIWLFDCPSLLLVVFVCFRLFERTRKGNMLQLQVGCPNVHICFLGNSENSLVFSEQVYTTRRHRDKSSSTPKVLSRTCLCHTQTHCCTRWWYSVGMMMRLDDQHKEPIIQRSSRLAINQQTQR